MDLYYGLGELNSFFWMVRRFISLSVMSELNKRVAAILRVKEVNLEKARVLLRRIGLAWNIDFKVGEDLYFISVSGTKRAYQRLVRYKSPPLGDGSPRN